MKRWTKLGLGTILAGSALAACNSGTDADKPENPEGIEAVASPGAGGEGEGGVSIEDAATNSVVYNSALAIAEAHVLAARDAYAIGENMAAAEMFAHPVSEVLHDMQPIFRKQGVEDFNALLTEASAAALAGQSISRINAQTDRILAVLRAASQKNPDDGKSDLAIAGSVAADQINRAANMYHAALESGQYEPYLDGYGFFKAGEAAFVRVESDLEARDAKAAEAMRSALALLSAAYPDARRPKKLKADASQLIASASRVTLAISNL